MLTDGCGCGTDGLGDGCKVRQRLAELVAGSVRCPVRGARMRQEQMRE
jgi:hypothetical protein